MGYSHPLSADELLDAMVSELNRTNQLKSEDFNPPYFVSYSVYDFLDLGFDAEFGAIFNEFNNHKRRGYVEVRVGDYSFDNSVKGGVLDLWSPNIDFDRSYVNLRMPLENDADAIRTQLWLVTDTTYKAAAADYLQKKGRKIYMIAKDEKVDDFSREKPVIVTNPIPQWDVDKEYWKQTVKEASALFKKYPAITRGLVSVSFSVRARRLANTEGTRITDGSRYFVLRIWAETRAPDGQKLTNFFNFNARSNEGLPRKKEVLEKVELIANQLEDLSRAEKLAPYTGPAILDPSLAGVFFHEAVGHRLEGERQKDTDEGQTFKGKIGEKILPEFITLEDDPTLKNYQGVELFGNYQYDDEGVAAKDVELVKNGVLKTFLMSREPIEGVDSSNGHGRSDGTRNAIARMATTIVKSKIQMDEKALKRKLIQLAKKQKKPFALILRRAQGGETATTKYNFQAFKHSPVLVYKVDTKTGKETLVRGAEVVGTPLVSLNKVVASGNGPEVFNGYCGAESGWIPVSVIAPSLLISEIELQRVSDKPIRPPILPAPFAENEVR